MISRLMLTSMSCKYLNKYIRADRRTNIKITGLVYKDKSAFYSHEQPLRHKHSHRHTHTHTHTHTQTSNNYASESKISKMQIRF